MTQPETRTPPSIERPLQVTSSLVQFAPAIGRLISVPSDGGLVVQIGQGTPVACQIVEGSVAAPLSEGDRVLVTCTSEGDWVVLGRITNYQHPRPQRHIAIDATESLSLACGQSSIELRADGKVMIRGDDVLVRAKGTKRIRAGTVSIN